MPTQPRPLPAMRLHKPSGQARVLLAGHHEYLGKWGTPEAEARYHQVIGQYLALGCTWPPPVAAPSLEGITSVAALADRYLPYARAYYVKGGKPTHTAANADTALSLLFRAGLANVPPAAFGPKMLRAFQVWMASHPDQPWSRSTINEYSRHVVAMFKWAVSEELVEESVWRRLTAVGGLPKGRPPAPGVPVPREGEGVDPVPQELIDATHDGDGRTRQGRRCWPTQNGITSSASRSGRSGVPFPSDPAARAA